MNEKDLAYYKANAEEDYKTGACLSVLRYISELEKAHKETLAELEEVKTTRDQYFKAAIHAQEKLAQAENELRQAESDYASLYDQFVETEERMQKAEKERDELIEAAKKVEAAWLNWDEDGSRQMTAAIDEMEQLLTPKE